MNLVCCITQVPDTAARIKLAADGKAIETSDVNFVLNPYDEFAVEEALRLRDQNPGSTVTIVTVGDESVTSTLRKTLAMGADKAVRVNAAGVGPFDAAQIAAALVAAIGKLGPLDLVLFGKESTAANDGQVGPLVAEGLGLPSASVVVKLTVADGKATVEREIEGGVERVTLPLPAVVTAQKGLNEPRLPSVKGIMMSKSKPVTTEDAAPGEPRIELIRLTRPAAKSGGRKLGSVDELIAALRDEAKVI